MEGSGYQTLCREWRCCAAETMILDDVGVRIRDCRQAEYQQKTILPLSRTYNTPSYQADRKDAVELLAPARLPNWDELECSERRMQANVMQPQSASRTRE